MSCPLAKRPRQHLQIKRKGATNVGISLRSSYIEEGGAAERSLFFHVCVIRP